MIQADAPALVLGASGFVGSHITRRLVQQGRKVRVMLRSTSKVEALQDQPVEIVYGDVLDPASLRSAMQGQRSIFYCVVDPRFWLTDQTPIFRNNVEGLSNAMAAALAGGAERFVFTSSMGTLGLNPNGPVSEEVPFNWRDRASPYILARLEAESRFLTCCRDQGLPGIALCVANTFGPQDYQPTPHNSSLYAIASGQSRITVDVSQPTVDIRDVAEAAMLAEQMGRIGERYIIANQFVSNRDLFAMAVARTGQAMPRFIPYRVAYALGWISGKLAAALGRQDTVFTAEAIRLANIFRELSSDKARQELGWSPRTLEDTVGDAVDWFGARDPGRK